MQRSAVKSFIQNGGHEVRDYENYDLAVETIPTFDYELCVFDIETTGSTTVFDYIKKIKASGLNPSIIVLSARIRSKAEEELKALGVTAFSWKPIRERDLLDIIQENLK